MFNKYAPFLVLVVGLLLVSSLISGFSYTLYPKSKLFQDYLVAGTFTDLTTNEANTITTGLSYVKAWGFTNSTTAEAIKSSVSGGTITAYAKLPTTAGSTTEGGYLPDGNWWSIGR